jgi:hypothetical protein
VHLQSAGLFRATTETSGVYYAPVYHFTVAKENSRLYSDNGHLYKTESGERMELPYWDSPEE